MTPQQKLVQLYSKSSKHSNYQVLPPALSALIGDDEIVTRTRSEKERWAYVLKHVNFEGKTVVDVGANTGYFTFEALSSGAKAVTVYEGNSEHAEFIKVGAEALKLDKKITVKNTYYTFENDDEKFDIMLLFNVLHHVGDDYGDKKLTVDEAKKSIISQLNAASKVANQVVFQLGFNWQGDPTKPLFDNGTKKEMIDYIKKGTESIWDIESIGIAESISQKNVYRELDDNNGVRIDALGEFLNRPLFILDKRLNG